MAIAAKIQETFTEALGRRMIYALEKEREKKIKLSWVAIETFLQMCCFWNTTMRLPSKAFQNTSAAAAAKLLQSCPTLCDPIDGSPTGSPVPGILQARTLEWVAISFSNAWKWKVKVKLLSRVWLLATPWTAAYQAPLSMGFSRREYWSGVPLPSQRQSKLGVPNL